MLADDIAAAVSAAPASAAELAERLGVAEAKVSYALFASHGRFRQGRGSPPLWTLAGAEPTAGIIERKNSAPGGPDRAATVSPVDSLGLYPWQIDALNAWRRHGFKGVVEAVTGTGKTMVGVAAALEQLARRGQVLVVVPTVELQHQWVAQLERRLPAGRRIGRLGAGSADTLAGSDVLVAVVNSARALDVRPIRPGGLIVADECHRYGSVVNRLALDERFTRRLGLSATYGRDDGGNASWLDPYFGGTCFEMGYARAVAEAVTARFSVTLLGVVFSPAEQDCYDQLSELMRALQARLIGGYGVPAEPFEAFLAAVAALADGDAGEGAGTARAYRQAMLERRRLLADTPAKQAGLCLLVPAMRAAQRSMIFTQSIAAAETAASVVASAGLRAGVVHSLLAPKQRREALAGFASGSVEVLAAPRVLDEGIDVPAADLAVIVGASRSRRQMVQRMGRVLRRKADGRRARFAVLFVEGTVEDPRRGAHEAFLSEMVEVADEVSCFPARRAAEQPGALIESLGRGPVRRAISTDQE